MEKKDLNLQIEAILFSYGDFVNISLIQETLCIDRNEIINSLKKLQKKYDDEGRSFKIFQEGDKYKMGLKDEFQELINEILSKTEIPLNNLKVLSIIAYESPITKTKLNKILGKSVIDEINQLHRQGFIQFKKKGIGKYYKVTNKFFEYFKIDKNKKLREELNKKLTEFSDDIKVNP
jgi:segregation and condensation protein B